MDKTAKNTICPICGKPTGRNKNCCSQKCYSELRQHYKICPVCGKSFKCPPSDSVKCCSDICSGIHRSDLHKKSRTYNNAKSKMLTARDIYFAEHTGEKHPNAKKWVIQSPGGQIYECRNLLNFIRERPELFDGTPKQACDGFIKIKASMLGKRKNPSYTWKGWRLISWD